MDEQTTLEVHLSTEFSQNVPKKFLNIPQMSGLDMLLKMNLNIVLTIIKMKNLIVRLPLIL